MARYYWGARRGRNGDKGSICSSAGGDYVAVCCRCLTVKSERGLGLKLYRRRLLFLQTENVQIAFFPGEKCSLAYYLFCSGGDVGPDCIIFEN